MTAFVKDKVKKFFLDYLPNVLTDASLFNEAATSEPSKKNVPKFPSYICMELTNACNLRCIHCLYQGGTTEHYKAKTGFMKAAFAKEKLDELKVYNCSVMLNGDGESLLHPRFHEIAQYAVSLGLPSVYFNTNGVLLTPEFTDEFVKYFKGMVSISLDGFKESHERIRRGSSYKLVTENIFYLKEQAKRCGAQIEISVAYCNYDQGEDERDEFVKYWVDRADIVSVCEVYDKDYKIISNKINKSSEIKRVTCGVPWETFIVRWNGLVIPCSNCFSLSDEKEVILGDANTQTLHDIWYGKNAGELRKRTEKNDLLGTICEKCERWNMYVLFGTQEEDGMSVTRSGIFTVYRKTQGS